MKKIFFIALILILGSPVLADNGVENKREVYGLYDIYWQTNSATASGIDIDEEQLERATEIINEWFYLMKKLEHKKLGYIIEIDRLMARDNKTRDYEGIRKYIDRIKEIEGEEDMLTDRYQKRLKKEVDLEKIQSVY